MGLDNVEFRNSISVEDYNRLRKSAGWKEIEPNQARGSIENSAFLVSVIIDGETVGMGRVFTDGGHVVVISDIVVLPQYQRKGLGKTIMNTIMDYIRNSIKPGEAVFVNLMAAKDKEPFYRKFGFVERPNKGVGAGMTQWITLK